VWLLAFLLASCWACLACLQHLQGKRLEEKKREEKNRKEKTFGVNLMRSQILYWAAQVTSWNIINSQVLMTHAMRKTCVAHTGSIADKQVQTLSSSCP